MKSLLIFCFSILLMPQHKHEGKGKIVNDCTGVYVQMDEGEYKICNQEDVDSMFFRQKVSIVFSEVEECLETRMICAAAHPHDGKIYISRIELNEK